MQALLDVPTFRHMNDVPRSAGIAESLLDEPVPMHRPPKPAIRISPAEINALTSKARAYENEGNFDAAVYAYDRLLAARPADVDALAAKGRCLLGSGRADEAVLALQRAVELAPDHVRLRMVLGVAYVSAAEFDKAVRLLRQVIAREAGNADAHAALGAAWMGLGNIGEARAELQKALQINPSLRDAHFNLAQVLCAEDTPDRTRAGQHYRRALALGAEPDPVLESVISGE
jgi:tetratricopeptide (TPR) repeat protein